MATLMVTSSGAAPRSAPARRPHQARRQLDALRERYARLTARERKVMTLVVAGHLNKEIASEVATTERTIKFHRAHIMGEDGGRLRRRAGPDGRTARPLAGRL